MNGSLSQILTTGLTNQQKLELLLQISSGISFLHSKKVTHLDLKPDNILVNFVL
jgi:serine/threonine protein kinase